MKTPARDVVPLNQMVGDDETDTALLRQMSSDARTYLESFDWCKSVGPAYWGGGVGGVFGIFLFQIEPSVADVDQWLWVVVGDIPTLYIVMDECASPKEAADTYLALMGEWVELARQNRSSPDIPPTGVEATTERAEELEKRLQFIREEILPRLKDNS